MPSTNDMQSSRNDPGETNARYQYGEETMMYQFVLEKTACNENEIDGFTENFRRSGKDWMIVSGIVESVDRYMDDVVEILRNEVNGMAVGSRIFFRILIKKAVVSVHLEKNG